MRRSWSSTRLRRGNPMARLRFWAGESSPTRGAVAAALGTWPLNRCLPAADALWAVIPRIRNPAARRWIRLAVFGDSPKSAIPMRRGRVLTRRLFGGSFIPQFQCISRRSGSYRSEGLPGSFRAVGWTVEMGYRSLLGRRSSLRLLFPLPMLLMASRNG